MRDYAKIAAPLHHLTEKEVKKNFIWKTEHERAFSDLKTVLCTAPVLALPNFVKDAPPFILDTDASDTAIGAMLSQRDDQGHERVIAYASKKTVEEDATKECHYQRAVRDLHLLQTV